MQTRKRVVYLTTLYSHFLSRDSEEKVFAGNQDGARRGGKEDKRVWGSIRVWGSGCVQAGTEMNGTIGKGKGEQTPRKQKYCCRNDNIGAARFP